MRGLRHIHVNPNQQVPKMKLTHWSWGIIFNELVYFKPVKVVGQMSFALREHPFSNKSKNYTIVYPPATNPYCTSHEAAW